VRNGYSTAAASSLFRVALGSKYQATWPHAQAVWQEVVIPTQLDVWIWAGNMAHFDSMVINSEFPDNAGQAPCQCGTSGTVPNSLCNCVTCARPLDQTSFVLQRGYSDLLDYICDGYTSACGSMAPGSRPDVCRQPVLGTYGLHDSFEVLQIGNLVTSWQ
jgi:hypothetical protein